MDKYAEIKSLIDRADSSAEPLPSFSDILNSTDAVDSERKNGVNYENSDSETSFKHSLTLTERQELFLRMACKVIKTEIKD